MRVVGVACGEVGVGYCWALWMVCEGGGLCGIVDMVGLGVG